MTSNRPHQLPSFPVPDEHAPVRRRALFSKNNAGLQSHHVQREGTSGVGISNRRRKLGDDSLRLIDDLTNRPVDPLFSDARLIQHHPSAFSVWSTRIIVFIICVAVGFLGSLFVQQLQADPRKAVRTSLANELTQLTDQLQSTSKDVSDLRSQIEQESQGLTDNTTSSTALNDELTMGSVAVQGSGITLTLADPIAASNDNSGSLPRENSSGRIRVVTDADLQIWVSLLWRSGAEAISINGNRLGVQTSVRTAGETILIGVKQIQSPYTIEAIGDKNALASALSASQQQSLYDSFAEAGIYPQVSKSDDLTLSAADPSDVTYARRAE